MQEGAAAARGDKVHVELVGVVAVVVMPVAGDDGDHAGPARPGDRGDLEEVLLLVEAVHVGDHPGRLGQADDEVVAGRHLPRHRLEVVDLRGVEVLGELDVGAPDPPVVGQPERPVAAVLLALPAADHIALGVGEPVARGAEQAVEGVESIVPVVVAGDGEQLAGGLAHAECPAEGLQQALLVVLAGGLRVALVAAHDQDLAVAQIAGAAHLEAVLGQQIGARVGGVEAVAHVGDVVDPQRAGGIERQAMLGIVGVGVGVVVALTQLAIVARVGDRLHQALVGVLAEHRGDDGAHPTRASRRGSYHDTICGRRPERSWRRGFMSIWRVSARSGRNGCPKALASVQR